MSRLLIASSLFWTLSTSFRRGSTTRCSHALKCLALLSIWRRRCFIGAVNARVGRCLVLDISKESTGHYLDCRTCDLQLLRQLRSHGSDGPPLQPHCRRLQNRLVASLLCLGRVRSLDSTTRYLSKGLISGEGERDGIATSMYGVGNVTGVASLLRHFLDLKCISRVSCGKRSKSLHEINRSYVPTCLKS